jgi:hypothetical protein
MKHVKHVMMSITRILQEMLLVYLVIKLQLVMREKKRSHVGGLQQVHVWIVLQESSKQKQGLKIVQPVEIVPRVNSEVDVNLWVPVHVFHVIWENTKQALVVKNAHLVLL